MKRLTPEGFILLGWLCTFISFAQTSDYIVNSPRLAMRSGPGNGYKVIHTLSEGEAVSVLKRLNSGWWQIEHQGVAGYALGKYLAKTDTNAYRGWEKTSLASGDKPDCFNFSSACDSTLDNYLKVNVGSNTDVVIKLMNLDTEQCIRYVYVNSGENLYIRNIPQGVYCLKIAYGRDWRQRVIEGQCYGKFMIDSQYERGKENLDFRVRETQDGYQIPMFELFLDVIRVSGGNVFHSNSISEAEFNK